VCLEVGERPKIKICSKKRLDGGVSIRESLGDESRQRLIARTMSSSNLSGLKGGGRE
jgi:hypothetical protein